MAKILVLTDEQARMISSQVDPLIEMDCKDNVAASDIIVRSDYVATVLWSREDLKEVLKKEGYFPSEENVDTLISSGNLKNLGSLNDSDWNYIEYAISCTDNLQKQPKNCSECSDCISSKKFFPECIRYGFDIKDTSILNCSY